MQVTWRSRGRHESSLVAIVRGPQPPFCRTQLFATGDAVSAEEIEIKRHCWRRLRTDAHTVFHCDKEAEEVGGGGKFVLEK